MLITLQIEFPSILLPPSITSGSIVDITVSRNTHSEAVAHQKFAALQSSILETYGLASPSPPVLRCRNATQTSVVLEWDPIQLATADLRSLSLYRNGAKAGVIPRRGEKREEVLATKVSGLAVDTEYVFQLVLRTSAGTYSSEKLTVRTHKMTDLTGITVTPGVLPPPLRESLIGAVDRIGAKFVGEGVRIDTTHFVCTEGRGREWEKAVEMNIPVVRPEWVEGCEREGRIVGVRGYYLNADPRLRQVGQGAGMQQQQGQRPMQQQRMDSQRTVPVQQPQTPSQPQSAGLPPPDPAETPGSNSEDSRGPPPPLPEKDQPVGQEGAGGQEKPSDEDVDGAEEEDDESEEDEKGEKSEKVMEAEGDMGVPRDEDEDKKEEEEDEQGEGEGFDEVKL